MLEKNFGNDASSWEERRGRLENTGCDLHLVGLGAAAANGAAGASYCVYEDVSMQKSPGRAIVSTRRSSKVVAIELTENFGWRGGQKEVKRGRGPRASTRASVAQRPLAQSLSY